MNVQPPNAQSWTLQTLLAPYLELQADMAEIPVQGVSLDSRLVRQGDVYLAVKGSTTHGLCFAKAAFEQGAVAIVTSEDGFARYPDMIRELTSMEINLLVVPGLDDLCADIAARFYDYPDRAMTLIAVTGTDGKTSVCRFLAEAFAQVQLTCGYIGTIGWGVGDALTSTALTTPDVVSLRFMLANMRNQGAQFVALEASSHGIAEGRLDGLSIDVAVLTNLGRDHLDYHGTIDAYKAAKSQLFFHSGLQSVVLNVDSDFGRELVDSIGQSSIGQLDTPKRFTYAKTSYPEVISEEGSLFRVNARAVEITDSGLRFAIEEPDLSGSESGDVSSELLGSFNIDNLLACYATLRACGVAANDARHGISRVKPVAGRMERLGGDDKPTVVVDYCHTPQALSVAIDAVRIHASQQVWVVFGCGGDRDAGKRPAMAKASEAADHVVLTDDNPRHEKSQSIFDDAMGGFSDPESVHVIADRAQAIRFAIGHATAGDLVLIAGKGHEDYQIVGATRHYFSDREQALLALEQAS